MSFFIMYLLMILENVASFLHVTTAILGACSVAAVMWTFIECEPLERWMKWMIAGAFTCGLLSSLIPSKQDMAIIAAGGLTYEAVTSDTAKEIGGKVKDVINKKLDKMIEEEKK